MVYTWCPWVSLAPSKKVPPPPPIRPSLSNFTPQGFPQYQFQSIQLERSIKPDGHKKLKNTRIC